MYGHSRVAVDETGKKVGEDLAFNIEGIVGAEITHINTTVEDITASCYTYEGGRGRLSWCSCTDGPTHAECCDG